MPSRRPERVSGLLLEVVAETLLREVKDPRLQAITVTGVRMSPDLKTAKIFFTTRQEEEPTEVLAGLRKATGFIKRQVASRLQLRYIPDLEFRYDETLEKVNRLESLLRQAAEKERESLD
ncbi:MAG: 30S ribosome-binding factor RbfA [Candidatus Binatia bacterium]